MTFAKVVIQLKKGFVNVMMKEEVILSKLNPSSEKDTYRLSVNGMLKGCL